MQSRDDSVLLSGCQQGSLLARQQLVRQRQDELLRTAFLLTGDAKDGTTLAATALLDLFRALPRSNPDRDSREWLLVLLSRDYLAGRIAADRLANLPPTTGYTSALASGQRQHFQVDDERSRVLAALDRLERPMRTALVLTEFGGLEQQAVARITGQSLSEVRRGLEQSRDRVAEAAGRERRQVRGALSSLATGAPRVDLWPLLAEPLEQIEASNQRRNQVLIGGAVVVAVLVLLLGLVWLIGGDPFDDGEADSSASGAAPVVTVANSPASTLTPVPDEGVEILTPPPDAIGSFTIGVGELPDLQVVIGTTYDETATSFQPTASVLLTNQDTGVSSLIEGSGSLNAVSPDGRWALFVEPVWDEGSQTMTAITVYDLRAERVAWRKQIESEAGFFPFSVVAVALSPEQAYITNADGYIIALNLQTGIETGSWQVLKPESGAVIGTDGEFNVENRFSRLYIAPNQRRLYAFFESFLTQTTIWAWTVKAFNLPGMAEVASRTELVVPEFNDQWPGEFDFWSALPTVDGSSFYTLTRTEAGDAAIRFLDLRDNELFDVTLPDDEGADWLLSHTIPSNTGQWLYVISGDRRHIARVDLLQRRLERTFPLDYGGYAGWTVMPNASQSSFFPQSISALSQDGSRLYLVGSELGSDQGTSVLVIDTSIWQVIDRWQAPGRIDHLFASPDGNGLDIQTIEETGLARFDTEGNLVSEPAGIETFPSEEPVDWLDLQSLAEIYRRQFGLTPVVGGNAPEDVSLVSTLPGISITSTEPEVAAGNEAEIKVRFIDPATGDPLTAERADVRSDSSATITIQLTHEEAEPMILQPAPMEDGSFRALAQLDEHGTWAATVFVTNASGVSWSIQDSQVVDVLPSFIASDGRRYAPVLTMSPDDPVVGEPVTLRIEFRDTETGLILPEDVDFPAGGPDKIHVNFSGIGVTIVTLDQESHGVFTGTKAFRDAAEWVAMFRFRFDGENVLVDGGSLTVRNGVR